MSTQKIVPHIWFDKQAKEAAQFYASVFADSEVLDITTITNTPSGDCDMVSFKVRGYEFMAISAGPLFKLNPAISFMVNFDPAREVDAREVLEATWSKLLEGGKALMPLDKYPFSELYGWVQDKYGVSWQLILTDPEGEPRPPIIPSLMFVTAEGEVAEEATDFYMSVFNHSARGAMFRYPEDASVNKTGAVMFTDFKLEDQWFAAIDTSAEIHDFKFNEAVSLMVKCDTQAEIDHYWEKLSAVPEAEQCGWLKDKYGVSWQIIPRLMDELMTSGDQAKIDRVTQAFLKMKKFDIAELQKAANSNGDS